jgi:hypothetical protein
MASTRGIEQGLLRKTNRGLVAYHTLDPAATCFGSGEKAEILTELTSTDGPFYLLFGTVATSLLTLLFSCGCNEKRLA